jgi:hypothetical protein
MNKLEIAQDELLRQAVCAGNEIFKVKDESGDFVKVRRKGYSHPEEVRELYMEAFDKLVAAGKLRRILENDTLELYEVVEVTGHITTKRAARRALFELAQEYEHVYKIHSPRGEFVQCGQRVFNDVEEERILFLEVLVELTRAGYLRFVHDSSEVTHYAPSQPRFPRFEDDDQIMVGLPSVCRLDQIVDARSARM